jgi:hypothetical protein
MDSIVSSTELMKQAEHCGCASTPTLNQTGELKEHLVQQQVRQLGAEGLGVLVGVEVAVGLAPLRDGAGDALHQLRTERSRSGVPRWPRKYLEATTLW